MEEQAYHQSPDDREPIPLGGPGGSAEQVAEILINRADLLNFSRAAASGRRAAMYGHAANMEAGKFYLICLLMLKHGTKAAWLEAEAKLIGTTVRTLYNYIDLAKAEIEKDKKIQIQAMFLALSPEDQEKILVKAYDLAKLEDKTFNEAALKALAEQVAKEKAAAEQAARDKAYADYMAEPIAPAGPTETLTPDTDTPTVITVRTSDIKLSGGGKYNLTLFMTDAMRMALDILTASDNWDGAQLAILATCARVCVQYGIAATERELLDPPPYQAVDEDIPV